MEFRQPYLGAVLVFLCQIFVSIADWQWIATYTECSKSCDGGFQYRELKCFTTTDPPKPALDNFCTGLDPPSDPDSRSCNDQPCTTCERASTNPSGHLTSPFWPEKYTGVEYCILTVELPANHRVLFKFHVFTLDEVADEDVAMVCTCGTLLEISDGETRTDRYCGTKKQFSWISETNKVTAQFYTRSKEVFNRYEASYSTVAEAPECYLFVDLSKEPQSGFLKSVNFPNSYDDDVNCQYVLHADPVHRILLHFHDFDLEEDDLCSADFVKIEDQYSGRSDVFCGRHYPFSWLSDANELIITFKTNNMRVFEGFIMEYEIYDRIGDGMKVFTDDHATFVSPNFPQFYPPNLNMEYLIHGKPSHFVVIKFLDFQLEDLSVGETHCEKSDYIRILDLSIKEEVFYCGCLPSFSYVSKGNEIFIQFMTDKNYNGKGFKIMYSMVPKPAAPEWELAFRVAKGGETMAASKWLDTSQGYNEFNFKAKSVLLNGVLSTYKTSEVNDWANAGIKKVKIQLYESGEVFASFLFSAEGATTLIDWFTCENLLYAPYEDIFPCEDYLFTLDSRVGFEIKYLGVNDSCDEEDARVWLDLQDTVAPDDCVYENIEAKSQIFASVTSTGGEIASGGHIGTAEVFTIWIQRDCWKHYQLDLDDQVTSIQSPNFADGSYENNVQCDWVFTELNPFYQLRFDFLKFSLQESEDCTMDFVKIEDVQDGFSEQFCGIQEHVEWTTIGNSAILRFQTDDSLMKLGFDAEVTVRQRSLSDCSALIRSTNGHLNGSETCYLSENPQVEVCEIILHAHPSTRVVLYFTLLVFQVVNPPEFVIWDPFSNDEVIELSGDLFGFAHTSEGNELTVMYASHVPLFYNATFFQLEPPLPGDCLFYINASDESTFDWPTRVTSSGVHNCYLIIGTHPALHTRVRVTVEDIMIPIGDCESSMKFTDSCSTRTETMCETTNLPFTWTSDSNEVIVRLSHGATFIPHRLQGRVSEHERVPLENYKILSDSNGGEFKSPDFPDNYPNKYNGEYLLHAHPKHLVCIIFKSFILEDSINDKGVSDGKCSNDRVMLEDILSEEKTMYCGRKPPFGWTSSGNEAQVFLNTDKSVNKKGFLARYMFVPRPAVPGCDSRLTDTSGIIQSPNFPKKYNNNQACRHIIIVDPAMLVTLTFTFVEIQPHVLCAKDYVELEDVVAGTKKKFCGTDAFTWKSTANLVFVNFVSDGVGTFRGYQATYGVETRTEEPGCQMNFTATSGVFQSLWFPQPYPNNIDCTYRITVEEGFGIQLNFIEFILEPPPPDSVECIYDYLEIYDPTSPPAERLCGVKLPFEKRLLHNKITVVFHSDYVCFYKGFQAEFQQVLPVLSIVDCNQKLTAPSGTFTSPNYPRDYPNNKECLYTIQVAVNHYISITFTDFSLEGGYQGCKFDFVKVEDMNVGQSDTFCGRKLSAFTWESTTNGVLVTFHSDERTPSNGFSAIYESKTMQPQTAVITGCEKKGVVESTALEGELSSPGWPTEFYPPNVDCVVRLIFPEGHICAIDFRVFDLEDHEYCGYDFVKLTSIQDGASEKFCGHKNPFTWVSSGSTCEIHFHSDGLIMAQGYHANYFAIPKGGGMPPQEDTKPATDCIQTLRGDSGIFATPNFPGNYPTNVDCTTTIEVSVGKIIVITFDPFDLEYHQYCGWDFVQIIDVNAGGVKSSKLCGSKPNGETYRSSSNRVKVHFVSDYMEVGGGFKATYNAVFP